MKPLKVALCDDSAVDRAYLYHMCKRVKEQENVQIEVKEYETGESLLFEFGNLSTMNSVDIVLLDIGMPGKSGIEVAKELRKLGYQGSIIFITKSKTSWRAAFDEKALNYLIRDEYNVESSLMEVFIAVKNEAIKFGGKTLLFSSAGETREVEERRISYFHVKNRLVRVYYGDETFEFTSSLSKIEELLCDNNDFMRVNRDSMVSISHIEKVNKKSVVMFNGHEVSVSARKMKELKEAVRLSVFKE